MNYLILVSRIILTIILIEALVTSYQKLKGKVEYSSSFTLESNVQLPSLTLCPEAEVVNQIDRLTQVFDNTYYHLDKIALKWAKLKTHDISKGEWITLDLFDEDVLEAYFNTTSDEVWSQSLTRFYKDEYPHKCLIFSPPVFPTDKLSGIELSLQLTCAGPTAYSTASTYTMSIHDVGQSSMNGIEDRRSLIQFQYGGLKLLSYELTHTRTHHSDNPGFRCDESNSVRRKTCFDRYYSFKLNCTLPWLAASQNKDDNQRICDKTSDYEAYLNITKNIDKDPYKSEVNQFGCLMKNCQQNFWTWSLFDLQSDPEQDYRPDYSYGDGPPDGKMFGQEEEMTVYFQQFQDVVEVTDYEAIYTLSTFWADVGGYTGLLLGESIFSIVVLILEQIQKSKKLCFTRPKKELI